MSLRLKLLDDNGRPTDTRSDRGPPDPDNTFARLICLFARRFPDSRPDCFCRDECVWDVELSVPLPDVGAEPSLASLAPAEPAAGALGGGGGYFSLQYR